MGLQAWLTLTQIEGVLLQMLQISQKELFLLQDISSKYIYEIQKYFYEIASGRPQEYALWVANFYGRDFLVDTRVLIPRNDTEILVWAAVKYLLLHPELSQWVFVDVGTGSGCIALSVLQEIFPLKFSLSYALDISPDALEVCKKNAKSFPDIELQVLQCNLLEALSLCPEIQKKPLFICANLPYIKDDDTLHMDASVVKHEPHTALFWGKNTGFELYEKLIKQCYIQCPLPPWVKGKMVGRIGHCRDIATRTFTSKLFDFRIPRLISDNSKNIIFKNSIKVLCCY